MTEATLLIKRMPADLKDWLASEALRNHRSMNKETIRLLEETRIDQVLTAGVRDAIVNDDVLAVIANVEASPKRRRERRDDFHTGFGEKHATATFQKRAAAVRINKHAAPNSASVRTNDGCNDVI